MPTERLGTNPTELCAEHFARCLLQRGGIQVRWGKVNDRESATLIKPAVRNLYLSRARFSGELTQKERKEKQAGWRTLCPF